MFETQLSRAIATLGALSVLALSSAALTACGGDDDGTARPDGGTFGDAGGEADGHVPLPEHACASGMCVDWVFAMPEDTRPPIRAMVLHPSGGVVIAGVFSGPALTLGGMTTANAADGSGDSFVALLAGDGSVAWVTSLARPLSDAATALAVGADGTIFVGGYLDVDTAGAVDAANDAFVAAYDATGGQRWLTTFGDPALSSANQPVHSVDVLGATTDGGVIAMGQFVSAFTVDGVSLDSGGAGASFILRFGSDGNASAGTALPRATIEDGAVSEGDVLGVARAIDGATFGDAGMVSTDGAEIVVFRAGLDTRPTWMRELLRVTAGELEDPRLAVSPDRDRILVAGRSPAGSIRDYRLDLAGESLGSLSSGVPAGDEITVTDVALGPSGQSTFVGYASGRLDTVSRVLMSVEAPFIATFGSDDSLRWARFSDHPGATAHVEHVDRVGPRMGVAGYVEGRVTFDGIETSSTVGWRYFVMLLSVGDGA